MTRHDNTIISNASESHEHKTPRDYVLINDIDNEAFRAI